jgi:hypothetical protein
MATLPWTTTAVASDPGADAVVLGSRLELRSLRDVPAFMGAALKLRKQVREMPGTLGVSLIAQPSRKTFWTLSAWIDQPSLDAFVGMPAHVAVMRRFHDRLEDSAFTTWKMSTTELPEPRSNAKKLWSEVKQRLAPITPGAHNVY